MIVRLRMVRAFAQRFPNAVIRELALSEPQRFSWWTIRKRPGSNHRGGGAEAAGQNIRVRAEEKAMTGGTRLPQRYNQHSGD